MSVIRLLLPWTVLLFGCFQPSNPWEFPWIRLSRQRNPHQPMISSITFPNNEVEDNNTEHIDSYFMKLALEEAKQAGQRGEVPIGALVVRPGLVNTHPNAPTTSFFQILSAASNRVEELQDASAHAELLALRTAATSNGGWRLLNCTLYTTVEPCAMCLSAAQAFRMERIVYGAPDLRVGAIDTYLNLLETPHPIHTIDQVVRGVHQEESSTLMRDFFRQQRQQKKKDKRNSIDTTSHPRPPEIRAKRGLRRWIKRMFQKRETI